MAGTGPSTTIGQVGIYGKIVDRTARAWVDIQAFQPYWKFMRRESTHVLTAGTQQYSIVDDLLLPNVSNFDEQLTFLYEIDTNDESTLKWWDYPKYRRSLRTYPTSRPTIICEGPLGNITFDTVPDKAYTLTLNYWITPELLALDADVPVLPEQYHDVIVWASVMNFAGTEEAPTLYAYAKAKYDKLLLQLVVDQGESPGDTQAYPLASGRSRRSGF